MTVPTHLYVFGPLSGPYKIGYTFDLKMRGYDLRNLKMSGHAIPPSAKRHSIFWYHETLPSRTLAEHAELFAHRLLDQYRVARPRTQRKNQEWFDVELVVAIEVVKAAVAQTQELLNATR